MKKILILTPFYPPNIGGAESFVKGLVDEAKKWFGVTVITFQPFIGKTESFEVEYTAKGYLKVHRIRWGISHKTAWKGLSFRNFFSVFPKMLRVAWLLHKDNRYDVIHAQGLISGLVGAIIKGKTKLMITLLALYKFEGVFGIVSKWVLNRCDKIFVEGQSGFANVGNLIGRWSKIEKFKHWCAHDKFRNTKRTVDKTRILFIGRAIPEKGMYVVKACEYVLNDPNLEFEYVTEAKHEYLPKIYQRNHILCVPSQYAEGHTRVVIEGASCGCAIITSDKGALPEQVKDFGFVSSTEKFAQNLRIVINDWEKYSDQAYQYAKLNFSNSNAEVFLSEYINDII